MAKSGTVLVNLRKDWFSPDGSLYQTRDNPHEFPAEWAEEAKPEEVKPAKTVTTTVETPAEVSGRKYTVLPSTAEIVEDSTVVMVKQNTGGGEQVMVSSVVEGDVSAVGGAVGKDGFEEPSQPVAAAAKVAKDAGMDQVGSKPRESGPLPAGEKKPA